MIVDALAICKFSRMEIIASLSAFWMFGNDFNASTIKSGGCRNKRWRNRTARMMEMMKTLPLQYQMNWHKIKSNGYRNRLLQGQQIMQTMMRNENDATPENRMNWRKIEWNGYRNKPLRERKSEDDENENNTVEVSNELTSDKSEMPTGKSIRKEQRWGWRTQ